MMKLCSPYSAVAIKMCSNAGAFLIVFCICVVATLGVFQQQRAKVIHVNPKYITSVSIFTTRHNRRSPYTTDLNITSIAAWGNNVTITISFNKYKAKSGDLELDVKTCDMMKFKWARDWVEKFSNMSVDTCPLKKGTYRFVGFEVPPKNFPIPIGHGDYKNSFLVYSTKTKERILEISMDLKFNEK